jgi:hypothetical protein
MFRHDGRYPVRLIFLFDAGICAMVFKSDSLSVHGIRISGSFKAKYQ